MGSYFSKNIPLVSRHLFFTTCINLKYVVCTQVLAKMQLETWSLNVNKNILNWIVVHCYILFLRVIFSAWITWVMSKPGNFPPGSEKILLENLSLHDKNGAKAHFSLWKDYFLVITPYDQWTMCYFSTYVLARLLMFMTSLTCCWVHWTVWPVSCREYPSSDRSLFSCQSSVTSFFLRNIYFVGHYLQVFVLKIYLWVWL